MAESFSNLNDLFERSCRKFADRPAFGEKRDDEWEWTTFRDLHALVDRARSGLAQLGVKRGDRVAIISDNRVEWVVAAHATYGLGAAFVPLYQAQLPEERRFILADSGAKVVVASDLATQESVAAMHLPRVEHVFGLDRPAADARSWSALLQAGSQVHVAPIWPEPRDVADFIYTSGTTGKPKGVLLSHGNIASNVSAVHATFHFEPDDRSLAFLPWAHAYGQTCEVHGLFSMGASVAINDALPNLLANLLVVKPTILLAVPRIFNRIYEAVNREIDERPGFVQRIVRTGIRGAIKRAHGEPLGPIERIDLAFDEKVLFDKIRARFGGRLKYAISASATLGHDVAELIDAIGLTVYEGYGLTETSPIVSANLPGRRRLGSVGRPIEGVRVVIDRSVEGAQGAREGEIVVYGPNVMLGYHDRPEENARALRPDGGLRTGDLGYLDEDGYLFVTGRIKEQYKLETGRYVMPSPLEEELKLSPYVANVLLYGEGRPFVVALIAIDEESVRGWAQRIGISLESDPTVDPRVRELLEQEVALHSQRFKPFELPKRIALVREDFTAENGLLTPTLKLRRRDVVARYRQELESLYR